ncbi:type III restriction endonuclease subunit R, partial [Streptococcus suis]
ATNQVLGVGVDGLQHKFETIVVLDPVDKDSGAYDDYRQLLWRITGSRQQHDVNVIEFYYEEVI